MNDFPLLIFDMDGTLIDSFPGILLALNRALEEMKLPSVDLAWVRQHVGRGASRLIASASEDKISPEDLHRVFRRHYGDVIVENSKPFPGVEECLDELAGNHEFALASNKPDHWIHEVLQSLNWERKFSSIMGPDVAGAHKPNAAMIMKILEETGRGLKEALLIGDMPVDAETGNNAGIPVLGVLTGAATEEVLRKAGCVDVISSVTELPLWLGHSAEAIL